MKKPLLSLLLSLAYLLPAHADLSDSLVPTIVNGDPVRGGDPVARHTVALGLGQGQCSGTLIADDVMITAAHCLSAKPSIEDLDVNMAGDRRSVISVYIHPGYSGSGSNNDVALVRFSGGLAEGFIPAPIYPDSSRLRPGRPVIVAGFGATDPEGGGGGLRKVIRKVLGFHARNEIRLGGGEGSACGGDSGGPGFVEEGGRLFLVGVVSRSGGEGRCVGSEIHGRVDMHRAWIQAAIADMRGKSGGVHRPAPPGDREREAEEDALAAWIVD